MHDRDKSKAQLLTELRALRERVTLLEATDRSSSQGSATLGECPHFGQAALDSLSTPIAVLDASGTIIAVNTAWRRFADANDLRWPNSCLGANYLDVCDAVTGNDAEHAQQAARGIQEVMSRQRSVFSYEYPYDSADEQQWFRISSTRFSEDDSLYVVVAHENITPRKEAAQVLRQVHDTLEQGVAKRTAALQQLNAQLYEDIAARRHVEEALRASEEQFRSLIAGAIEGIIILRDFVPLFANQAYAEMFGYTSPEDILRMDTVFPLLAPHEHPRLIDYQTARAHGESAPSRYEFQGVRRDGSRIWLEALVTAVRWQGSPASQVTVLDITERKHWEDHIRQAQKMEALGTLAGGIAHDFNNILAIVIGYTELATFDVPQHSVAWQNLQEVLTASKRAGDLVQQILTFSRQNETERQPIVLGKLVGETLRLLRASLPSTIEIHHDIPEDSGTVLADPTQLHQVIMNLCANAEYAMRATGGLLLIQVDAVDVDASLVSQCAALHVGPYVRVSIRDTGHGMPPEVRERIFDPFFTTKPIGEGAGMGLAMDHGIVTNHGGAITVDSTPDDGTTITLYLPRIEDAPAQPATAEEFIMRGIGRILFVDDEEVLILAGRAMLEWFGYEVDTSSSGLEALDMFRANPHRYDLVITDQTMPQMTGEGLVQELRRIRPDIPIILCTGFSHVMDAEKAQTLGIDAFCMKPMQAQELASTIQQVLRRRSVEDM